MTISESMLPKVPLPVSGRRPADARRDSTAAGPRELDADWLRRALGTCGFLEQSRALCPADVAVVTFAVRWAPFGGSSPEDLLVTFGVGRTRFQSMLRTALTSHDAEQHRVREIKRTLRDDLSVAWGIPAE
ncbi:hypothetical protein [Rhodococcus gannanensis]|uniref:DUF3263 domain-containing protein n=1 Tax=Rhodococcus gannanensis TaxID=1960308 RepID=A0ABW4NWS5_9NOCA